MSNETIGEIFNERLTRQPILVDREKVATGQVVHGENSWEVFPDNEDKRLISVRELVKVRVDIILDNVDFENKEILVQYFKKLHPNFDQTLLHWLIEMKRATLCMTNVYAAWMDRFTTSTNMVHGHDGKMHFCDIDLTQEFIKGQIDKGLQDGAFDYSPMMDWIQENSYAEMDYPAYLNAKGGAFLSRDFVRHPVFSKACQFEENPKHMNAYEKALDVFSSDTIHKPGWHSGWVPGEIPPGYGRPIALGLGEAAFYPPNNSTKHHAGIHVDI